jgi:mRNA interferase RelE/StbE
LSWEIKFNPKAEKEFNRLDRVVQVRVMRYLNERAVLNPKGYGDPLTGNFKGLWRYRVGDYRIIVDIRENLLVIAVVRVAKRSDVYE